MDARELLIQRLDAAVARDMAEAVAIARLNDRLIDDEVMRFARARVAMTKASAQQAREAADIDRRVDVMMGALGIGSRGGGSSGGGGYVDQRGPIYEATSSVLSAAIMTRTGIPPGTSPVVIARARDILERRLSPREAVAIMLASSPPAQAQAVARIASLPGADAMLVPILRATAAGVADLTDLSRLFPNASLGGPPVRPAAPVGPAVAIATSTTKASAIAHRAAQPMHAPGADASLVEVLLYNAHTATDGAAAESLIRQALVAASHTPRSDDDILVAQNLIRMLDRIELTAETIRVAARVIGELAARRERPDEVAPLIGWVARAAVSRGLVSELGIALAAQGRLLLEGELTSATRAQLAAAIADLLVRCGRSTDASDVLRAALGRAVEPPDRLELLIAQAARRQAAGDRQGAAAILQAFLDQGGALPPALRRRALEQLVVVWPSGVPLGGRVDDLLAMVRDADELARTHALVISVAALVRTGVASDRALAMELARRIDLAAARARLPPAMREMFDAATGGFDEVLAELRSS